MNNENKIGCPMTYNIPPNMSKNRTYNCVEELCAWWCEDARKCALLVLAGTQRKAAKE